MATDPNIRQITEVGGRTTYINVRDIRAFYNYESQLIIEMIDGTSYRIDGAPNVNTFFTATFQLPAIEVTLTDNPLTIDGSIGISSIPPITISDIVNLNIDSVPPITGTIAISSVGGTINIATAQQALTYTMNQVSIANVSVSVLAANANRKHLFLRNQHLSGDIYVFFGATATLTNGMLIQNGETFTMPDEDGFIYRGQITAISANVTAKPLLFVEGV